ncbi:MAG: hypothetical protein FWG34_04035 [Oscillospiraceae bacterium]|nr:hypothetical protein [Oscillospiraceae bacterium]
MPIMNEPGRKNKKINRRLCLFAALIALSMAFACSCGNKEPGDGNDDIAGNIGQEGANEGDANEGQESQVQDNLPERNFDGYDFVMYMRDDEHYNADMYAESEIGEAINDAVYKRNKKTEERFNINIVPMYYDKDEWDAASAQKTILAGEDSFDIVAAHGAGAFIMAQKNYAVDWFENMPHVNFDAPWWAADTIKNLSAFGKLYCITGDISHKGLASTGCILFNKDLFESLGIKYPYDEVLNGKWTVEKFMSIAKSGASDLNGDGAMTIGEDRYGVEIRHEWDYPISMLYCGGDRVISIGDDGAPQLAIYNERTVDIVDKLIDMLGDEAVYMHDLAKDGNFPLNTAFRSGRSLFYTTYLQDVVNHRDLEYEIGILPLPKYEQSTPKYCTNVDAGQNVLSVPVTAADTERTSVIAEALCAEGSRLVMPAFYDVSLKTKYSRDDESSAMIDYVKEGRVYDYGYFNSSVSLDLAYVGQRLATTKNFNFTSFYEKLEAKVQKNIDDLNK